MSLKCPICGGAQDDPNLVPPFGVLPYRCEDRFHAEPTDFERERFEKWARKDGGFDLSPTNGEKRGYYWDVDTNKAFYVWQAARPAVDYEAAIDEMQRQVDAFVEVIYGSTRQPIHYEFDARKVVDAALRETGIVTKGQTERNNNEPDCNNAAQPPAQASAGGERPSEGHAFSPNAALAPPRVERRKGERRKLGRRLGHISERRQS